MKDSDNFSGTEDAVIVSNKHLRLLDNIFRGHHLPNDVSELQTQVIKWAEIVLSEERKEWAEQRNNSVEILCHLHRKEEARKRAAAKNERYKSFKNVYKELQKSQFKKYQQEGKFLSANAFAKWFLQNKANEVNIPYLKSNLTNQLIKLAQINNREFKKLLNAEADTLLSVED